MSKAPTSARMGCALNLERLRTELCSSHKATLFGPDRSAVSLVLWLEHSYVRSRSRFELQPSPFVLCMLFANIAKQRVLHALLESYLAITSSSAVWILRRTVIMLQEVNITHEARAIRQQSDMDSCFV